MTTNHLGGMINMDFFCYLKLWLFLCGIILFVSSVQAQYVDLGDFDPRTCDNPCVSNDLSIDSIYATTLDTMPFDPMTCGPEGQDTMLLACFKITNNSNSDRGAVFMAIDIVVDDVVDQTKTVCFPGVLPKGGFRIFCVPFNYKCVFNKLYNVQEIFCTYTLYAIT